MYLFSLRSKSLDHYNPVFSASSVAGALYMVRQSINTGSDLNLISDISDFELIQLGHYDDELCVFVDSKLCVCDDLTSIPGVSVPSVSDIRDVSSIQQSYDELMNTYNNLMESFKIIEAELNVYKSIYSYGVGFLGFIKRLFRGKKK